jgi:hypothetical protein
MTFVINITVVTNLVRLRNYRIKLRANNVIVFGLFSDIAQIAMINPPAKPQLQVQLLHLAIILELLIIGSICCCSKIAAKWCNNLLQPFIDDKNAAKKYQSALINIYCSNSNEELFHL